MGLGGERLARFQFFHIVRQLKSEFFTGEVRARTENEAITVRFSEGEPVDALSDSMKFSFPAFLLDRKLLSREETARYLEKSSRLGVKLEEALIEEKVYTEKQVRRLKADLSRRLFYVLFDSDDFVWTRVEAEVGEAVDKPFRLDPYEALFMAVSRTTETEAMALFFSDRWETPVRKTGDLYRHMIQFRSVFFDEEVLELVLAGEVPVAEAISRANDQQAALRQSFALCYTGMIVFSEEAGNGLHNVPEPIDGGALGDSQADSGRTVILMPETVEAMKEKRRQTEFIATRKDLDSEAKQAAAEVESEEILILDEKVEEPQATPPEKGSGQYQFPSAVWGGGAPMEEEPSEPAPSEPEPPKPEPPKPEPPKPETPKPEPPKPEPPKPAPPKPAPPKPEPPKPKPPKPVEKAEKGTRIGAPSAALPPLEPMGRPKTSPPKPVTRPGPGVAEAGSPETVDNVLKRALEEAESAISEMGPEEAAKLTQSRRDFGGSATMDYSDLMERKRSGDTGMIRKGSPDPITQPSEVRRGERRSGSGRPSPAARAHESDAGSAPEPEAPAVIRPQSPASAEDGIPVGFDARKTTLSTVGAPRLRDGEESGPGSPKVPVALQALPPLPARTLPQPDTDEHVEELLAKEYAEMRSMGFYGLLGVEPTSQLSEIRFAHKHIRRKHSDENYKSYVLSNRGTEILGLINTAADRARRILTKRAERRIYDERNGVSYPTNPQDFYSKLFDADDFFQQARQRMKMTHWVEAYNLLGRAADLNPAESEYFAYKAWALYQGFVTGQVRDDFAPNKARQILEKAVEVRETCERALYYRARLERDLGNTDDAATWYARLLRVNPSHPTARDEVKAITRPGGRSKAPRLPQKRGLWARLKALFGR